MSTTKKYLYICQDDDGDIFVDDKDGVDARIKNSEIHDEDIDFNTIGRIPREHLTVDFPTTQIEWYGDDEREKSFVDKAVIKIVQALTTGL
jgi:hypothetical protein